MMLYDSGFIGQDYNNCVSNFTSGDTEELFIKNKKNQPDDWYYHTNSISYKYNNNGHRCKDANELDFDNYILFTGCSHTEGIGLQLETSYPYILAKELNCDYYNLSLSASGVDILEYNLLTWFYKYNKKPKFVFIQWPDHSRFMSLYPGYKHLIPNGSWCNTEEERKFFVSGETTGFFNARKFISMNLINILVDVPTITVNLNSLAIYDNYSLSWKKEDHARDMAHFGIKSHMKLKNMLLTNLEFDYKYINARDNHNPRG